MAEYLDKQKTTLARVISEDELKIEGWKKPNQIVLILSTNTRQKVRIKNGKTREVPEPYRKE